MRALECFLLVAVFRQGLKEDRSGAIEAQGHGRVLFLDPPSEGALVKKSKRAGQMQSLFPQSSQASLATRILFLRSSGSEVPTVWGE
jgi:hypothetical protein